MQIGYRIIRPSDVGTQAARFAQISLWSRADWGVSDGERGVQEAIAIARECALKGTRTVYHPLEYPLTGSQANETVDVLRRLATASDLGIIVHDEGGENRGRLSSVQAAQYGGNVEIISRLCPISIENSFNSGDITWFWEQFVLPLPETVSITLDIGHVEGAGINSISFIDSLAESVARRIRFVHIHHYNELARGVKDHRPLVQGCREIEALKLLLKRKKELWVIVELDAAEAGMRESIELLERVKAELP